MTTLYFPQLAIGSLAQYPIARRWSKTVTINNLPNGTIVSMSAPTPASVAWELRYSGLSGSEWDALESLFTSCQGRFGNFTFLDPTDNLLTWSEDFGNTVWASDAFLQVTAGIADPFVGAAAARLSNSGQAPQRITQRLSAPSWFQYCLSAYARAESPSAISLLWSSDADEVKQTFTVGNNWERVVTSGALAGHDDGVGFGFELEPGVNVILFGPQVEAQPGAGAYKRKFDRSGIYSHSRFDQDALLQTAETSDQYSTVVHVIASN